MLCVCVLFLLLFLSPIHHSRWGANTKKCALSVRCSVAAWHLNRASKPYRWRPGVWQSRKHLEPVVHPVSAGKHQRPLCPRKATAPPHTAAIQFLGWESDPPKSGSSFPPWSGSSSSAAIQLLPPSGETASPGVFDIGKPAGFFSRYVCRTSHFWPFPMETELSFCALTMEAHDACNGTRICGGSLTNAERNMWLSSVL